MAIAPLATLETSVAQPSTPPFSNWTAYESAEGQFSASMPASPEQLSRTIPIASEPTDWTIWQVSDDTGTYAIAYSDLSTPAFDAGMGAVVDDIQQTLFEKFDWEPLDPDGTPISSAGHTGREFVGRRGENLAILRLYLAERRLYAVLGTSDTINTLSRFLESFAVEAWQPYSSEQGGFTVSLPRQPHEESTVTQQVSGQEVTWTTLEARNLAAPDDRYTVAYADVSSEQLNAGEGSMLALIGNNLSTEMNVPFLKPEGNAISLDGNPGRSYLAATDSGGIVAINLFLVGQRLYGVGIHSNDIEHVDQFLSSFQLQ